MKFRYFFFIFLIIIFISPVLGLGVSPAKIEMEFNPNLQTSFEMGVHNYPPKNYDVEIYSSLKKLDPEIIEEFRNIISLSNSEMTFKNNEDKKALTVNLNFPEGFSKGGIHELRIGARPYVEPTDEGFAIISGNEIRILINVSEEYVDQKYEVIQKLKILEINAEDVNQGEDANIEVKIKSESEIDLNEVYAAIKVSKQGRVLKKLATEKISIGPGEEKILNAGFNVESLSGSLILEVEVFYGLDSVIGEGVLKVIEDGTGGIALGDKVFKFSWVWVVVIVVVILLIIIIFLLILILKKKK
jgi:hypothetical protein